MSIIASILLFLYLSGLLLILVYTIFQFQLAYHCRRWYREREQAARQSRPENDFKDSIAGDDGAEVYIPKTNTCPGNECPVVTVQLPVYNERYVIERLLHSVSQLDWPSGKLEIQILDDSSDDTTTIIENMLPRLPDKGHLVSHIRRGERTGFKAGALQYGLGLAAGDFIAIFDADFMPEPDFLKKTIPAFSDPGVGMVQTRWGHINSEFSLLTRLQALALNAHFTVEQAGRNMSGHFMNFNGTAGVWRKSCIMEAGGWQHDTLTEDLDLSYRAQLAGWKFRYLPDVVTPAELPVAVSALKTQQYRWTKGAAETARKNLGSVIAAEMPLQRKLHAISHLLNSSVFIWIFIVAVTSVPLLWLKHTGDIAPSVFNAGSIFLTGLLMWIYFYETSMLPDEPGKSKRWSTMLTGFPMFLALSMGLGLHNSIAALSGYLGVPSDFIRTPKFNVQKSDRNWLNNIYIVRGHSYTTLAEGLLALYFLFGAGSAFYTGDFGLLPFHLLLMTGYGVLFLQAVREVALVPAKS
jgi:cellulose synthase/poly-beta-1,6-N-acetylglucosamine synthase-like glycosyltransferase